MEEAPSKHEITFEHWLFKVKTIQQLYCESTFKEVIIYSLKGAAATLVSYFGPDASVNRILGKLEAVYGTVAKNEKV